MGNPGTPELNRFKSNGKTPIIGLISPCHDFSLFWIFSESLLPIHHSLLGCPNNAPINQFWQMGDHLLVIIWCFYNWSWTWPIISIIRLNHCCDIVTAWLPGVTNQKISQHWAQFLEISNLRQFCSKSTILRKTINIRVIHGFFVCEPQNSFYI